MEIWPIAWQYHTEHYYDDALNDITMVFEENIHQQ